MFYCAKIKVQNKDLRTGIFTSGQVACEQALNEREKRNSPRSLRFSNSSSPGACRANNVPVRVKVPIHLAHSSVRHSCYVHKPLEQAKQLPQNRQLYYPGVKQ